ncbi:MAG: cytidyltransferase [Pelagibacteraceae bacterium]|nr:cytidyltransferase [Pelagibacteraceae bacterium]
MKYSMFIGRWQTIHDGHRWLWNQALDRGKNALIMIRDCELDKNNPLTAPEILYNLTEEFEDEIIEGRVKLMIVPDIESINYGRGVGYEVIEHIPPPDIKQISGTNIRKMRNEK